MRFTFIHTSDIHGRLFPYDLAPTATDKRQGLTAAARPFGGMARLGHIVRRERARSERSLYLDSGDVFQGAPIFNYDMGESGFRSLNALGVDAMALGNHEFDAGVKNLVEKIKQFADFPILAANYKFEDPSRIGANELGDLVGQYEVFNVKGIKVAVIGMGDTSSLSSIGEGGNSMGITPLEPNEIVRKYIRLLHDSVDMIVILSHLGLSEDEEMILGHEITLPPKAVEKDSVERLHSNWELRETLADGRRVAWVPGVDDIDVILGGHLHIVLNPSKTLTAPNGRTTIVCHSGAFAKYVGRLDVMLRDDIVAKDGHDLTEKELLDESIEKIRRPGKRIISHKYQIFPIDNRLKDQEDMAVAKVMEPFLYSMNQELDLARVFAYAPHNIHRTSKHGNGDSALGNLITESMRQRRRVEAEFAVTNTLGMRDSIYAGSISLEDLFNIFPFENTVTVMYMNGREVQDLFNYMTERSASRGCQSQAMCAGASYIQNCAQVKLNQHLYPCDLPTDCCQYRDSGCTCAAGSENTCKNEPGTPGIWTDAGNWECNSHACYMDPAEDIKINGVPLIPDSTYKLATNDYLAGGGSGFKVLKRNTTKFNTGVSLRDNLIEFLGTFPTCQEYAKTHGTCSHSDAASVALCKDLTIRYPNVPCIDVVEDGRIQIRVSQESMSGGIISGCTGPGCDEEGGT